MHRASVAPIWWVDEIEFSMGHPDFWVSRADTGLGIINEQKRLYTPVRKVLAQKKVFWPFLGGNGSTRTILCQTCAVLGKVTDFRLTHRKYARVIKAQSSHIKW